MALFKISKGNSENLPSKETSWGNGYAWFTQDDGKFYIDYYDGDDSITPLDVTKKIRQPLNAYKADRDKLGNQLDTYYAHSLTLDDTNHRLVLKAYGTTVLSNVNTAEVSTSALGIDDSPTPGSINLVTSDGISTALSNKQNKILVDGILEGDGTGNISAADTLSGSFLNLDTSINEYSQNNPVTSAAVYNFVTSSLGSLSGAMHFKGTTTTTMTDGRTTAAVTINGSSYTPEAGDVVIYSDSEYIWTGSAWERLGRDSSFKVQQSTVDSGTVATNKWASRIEQSANGEITVTMATLDTSGTWSGTATTASKLSNTSKVGDTNKPVYFTANGVPSAISYTIDKSVPSTAVFTDTATAADGILDGSNSGTQITYAPYSAQQSKLSFDISSNNPSRSDRLNLNGYLYATRLYSGGSQVLTSATSSGSGNVVTAISASNGTITYTLGEVSTVAAQIIRW